MDRGQFTFYRSFWEALKLLPKEEKLPFVMAICAYAFGDESCPEAIEGQKTGYFALVKPNLDSSIKKAESGKKGGSKPKAKRKQTASNETGSKETESNEKESKESVSKHQASAEKQAASYIEGESKKEKEKEKEVEGDTPLYPPAVASVLADYLNRINPSASPASLDELKGYAEEMGEAVCKRAFDIALDSKIATWPYIRAILRDKLANGVKCLADWDALEERRPKQGKSGNTGAKYDYSDKGDSL